MRIKLILIILIVNLSSCGAQTSLDKFVGGWAGRVEEKNPFLFDIEIKNTSNNGMAVVFSGIDSTTEIRLERETDKYLVGRFQNQLLFRIDTTTTQPIAFIQTGHHLSNIELNKSPSGTWAGEWNLLISESSSPLFYLSLDKSDDGNYSASTFFKEPTFHYMLGQGFTTHQNEIEFSDIRSNILFKGVLKSEQIDLTLNFLNEKTKIKLRPLPFEQWEIGQSSESINNTTPSERFSKLITDIENDTLVGTHSVIISQHRQILFEQYFDGFTANTPHDTRSLSKSFASAITGIAILDQRLKGENLPIKNFFETKYPDMTWGGGKEKITIHHLLTMSSGLDAIDFGLNRNSFANEGVYQSQQNWTKYILSAPMVYQPGEMANYGSGNPHLLSPILNSQIEERLEFYIHKKLFEPLSIYNYRIQTNNQDQPYFGGGWYLTPKDLLKFGQLYLNNGLWDGEEIISQQWIKKSFDKYYFLDNTFDKNEYGYLFWHKTYNAKGKKIASIEARGSGGQYLFIIPEYELVVVITSGNYRNNKGFQPEIIMEKYILPEIVK